VDYNARGDFAVLVNKCHNPVILMWRKTNVI
jgi:hypothetical protein